MGDHGLIVGGLGLGHRQFRLDPGCPGRFLDPLRALLEELESSTTEEEIAAERAVAKTTNVVAFTRKRPARQPFPEHLRRERVVEPGPTVCLCCGSPRPRKFGEDITETLEVVPRQWEVIQHIREKFTCRDCEKISQADQRRQCKFGSRSLNSKFITSDISSIGEEEDRRAWLDAAGRALQRRGVGPAANVVGRIEIGIYTAPPRVRRSLECRDFEFERLPVGIDYQVQQKRVP